MIVDSIHQYLSTSTGITDIVGKSVFPLTVPQGASFPAVVFTLDEDNIDQLLDEVGGLRRSLVSIDCYSKDHPEAHQLADATEAALIGKRGTFGTKTAEFITLQRRFELLETDSKLYRVSMQFAIAYF
jgi:hypothetical protein